MYQFVGCSTAEYSNLIQRVSAAAATPVTLNSRIIPVGYRAQKMR